MHVKFSTPAGLFFAGMEAGGALGRDVQVRIIFYEFFPNKNHKHILSLVILSSSAFYSFLSLNAISK